MKLSTLRDLATIILTLLLIPEQSRIMVLGGGQPSRWYAETALVIDKKSWVIAKNAGSQTVKFNHVLESIPAAKHFDQPDAHLPSSDDQITPQTLAVLSVGSEHIKGADRWAILGDGYHFRPQELQILTPAELTKSFILLAFLVSGFCFLGFYVASYIEPRNDESLDKESR